MLRHSSRKPNRCLSLRRATPSQNGLTDGWFSHAMKDPWFLMSRIESGSSFACGEKKSQDCGSEALILSYSKDAIDEATSTLRIPENTRSNMRFCTNILTAFHATETNCSME